MKVNSPLKRLQLFCGLAQLKTSLHSTWPKWWWWNCSTHPWSLSNWQTTRSTAWASCNFSHFNVEAMATLSSLDTAFSVVYRITQCPSVGHYVEANQKVSALMTLCSYTGQSHSSMSVARWANHHNPSWTRPVGQSDHCQNQDRNIYPINCEVIPADPIRKYLVKELCAI